MLTGLQFFVSFLLFFLQIDLTEATIVRKMLEANSNSALRVKVQFPFFQEIFVSTHKTLVSGGELSTRE